MKTSTLQHLKQANEYCDQYRTKLEHQYFRSKSKIQPGERKRIISISDLHIPFYRHDLVKEIVLQHSGADYLVINGDLFDNYTLSPFPKNKEIPFLAEYQAAQKLIRACAQEFGQVILIDGNHEAGRFSREIGKLQTTVSFLIKKSPLKYICDGKRFDLSGEELDPLFSENITYAGDHGLNWAFQIGQVIFAHRLKGYTKAPMGNALTVAKWMLGDGARFQCLVSGHSHRCGTAYLQGRLIIDQGSLCLPMEYTKEGRCTSDPHDLGYAVVELDRKGNVDPKESRVIHLGTYQQRVRDSGMEEL